MIISFTGHRPDKLGGYQRPNCQFNTITELIHEELVRRKPTKVISGMALGVDQWAAEIALDLAIPLIAAIPFLGQELAWPPESQEIYRAILSHAMETVVVSSGGYAAYKMQKRNEWMVDSSDFVVAVWDGSSGGTANCVKYIKKVGKPFINLWELI